MARVTDAILQNNVGWAAGRQNPMIDLQVGGMMGFSPDYTQWVSNQAYVRRNLFALLIEAPRGFRKMTNPEKWVGTLRALVELQALSIDGLNMGLEVEVADTAPVGGSGEMHQDFTNVTRVRSNPVFRFTERYGMPIASFFKAWITNLMMDPDSKVAGIATLGGDVPTDMLADMYAATMLFVEPDPTHTKVVKSWLCTNMFPQGTGEITGRRELTAAGEAVTYDINFTAITQSGIGVDAFAQKLMDGISLTGANPNLRPAFVQNIEADIAATTQGYTNGIQTLANTSIRL